ncbi:MAG TPA: hypothetical protein PKC43_06705 [Phycisphaerales bacterium]|nr:hypothetical protein [Phycisphaerales bacterium]HMP37122.1 hypothetical protein [Phycisphaerales bacterium]
MSEAFQGSDPASLASVADLSMVVWCSADQAELVRRVVAAERIALLGVCGADPMQTATLAQALGLPGIDDPRKLGRDPEAGVVWLAADVELPSETIRQLARRSRIVATSLQPSTLADLAAGEEAPIEAAPLTAVLPPLEDPEFRAQFGRAHGIVADLAGPPQLGGIGARLYDFADLTARWLAPPASVTATWLAADGRSSPPPSPRGAGGTLSIQLRDESGAVAVGLISTASAWRRRLAITGPLGLVEIGEQTIALRDEAGRLVDCEALAADAPEAQIARQLVHPESAGAPADRAARLAICEAAWLSCRTGAAESPSQLMETLRRR